MSEVRNNENIRLSFSQTCLPKPANHERWKFVFEVKFQIPLDFLFMEFIRAVSQSGEIKCNMDLFKKKKKDTEAQRNTV